jgi:hypothetical protein
MSTRNLKFIIVCLLFLCLVLAGLLPHFVRRPSKSWFEDKDQRIREMNVGFCEDLLANPRVTVHPRSLTQTALKKWQNGRLDPEPVLMFAVLVQNKRTKPPLLILALSDEDGDVASIRITERHFEENKKVLLIEEEYPVFGYGQVICSYNFVPIEIRTSNERKDQQAWQNYLDVGIWKREAMPTIWISLPKPSETNVEIQVYDHAGHESNPVPLENKIPPVENSQTEKKEVSE